MDQHTTGYIAFQFLFWVFLWAQGYGGQVLVIILVVFHIAIFYSLFEKQKKLGKREEPCQQQWVVWVK